MKSPYHKKRLWLVVLSILTMIVISACNLGAPESDQVEITSAPTNTGAAPTRTLQPTGINVTPILFPTQVPQQISTVSVVQLPPTTNPIPTNTTVPASIVILSPLPNNIISGNTQILGSAIHPSFLQYRVEFGPDPNPNNLWFPITGVVQTPILNGILGVWNTTTAAAPDGNYQIRLRVFLRDGSEQSTVINNVRIQNQQPTPIPTNTPTIPLPIAGFTQDITSGNAPLVVKFTDLSQGQINTYSWDFDDGGNSNNRNPTHTFNTPGLYTVKLKVTGPGGNSNVTRQINVKSPTAPVANFTVSPNSGESPFTAKFTNTTTGNATSYIWKFGDNSEISTKKNPSHTYNVVGTYNVILEAIGPGGQTSSIRQVTVTNPQVPAPVADFDMSTQTGQVPLTLQLTNKSTGNIDSYLWDFDGDNITDSVDKDPTTKITTPGDYTIRLIVIGPGGQSETTKTVSASNPPNAPVASFSASPESGDAPLTVSFTNSTTGDVTGYVWDFNSDGQPDNTETNPSTTFAESGTYVVQLTAAGPGGSTTATKTITVLAPLEAPIANFDANPTIGEAPLAVDFTNTSIGSELTISWDFQNDGVIDSNENSPSTEYTVAGSYTVILTVSNSAGTDTASQTINVSEVVVQLPPTAAFSASPMTGEAPLTVAFNNQSFGDVTSYEWDFQNDDIIDSTETSPNFSFNTAGNYTVKLKAIGPGGSNEITSTITVTEPQAEPVAGFSALPTNLTVALTSTATGDNLTYLWDFGDGNQSSEINPSHTYASANTYSVTQTVSNGAGSNSVTQQVTVTEPLAAPVAGFSALPTDLTVAFTSTATGDNLTYLWDFGDGNQSSEINPSHTYASANTYNVTQTVSNGAGSNSVTQQVTVTEPLAAPVAGFSAFPTDLTVAFTSTATGDNLTYLWDFGDGNSSSEPNPVYTYASANAYNVTQTVSNGGGSNSTTQQVTVTEPVQQQTTPDGDIVFVSNRDGNNEIYVMNTDGTEAVNVTNNPANDTQPSWSPDGNRIVFVSDRDGDRNIYILEIDTLEITRLTSDNGDNRSPVWSPDGNKIAFSSDRFSDFDIMIMNPDGSDQIQLTVDASDETDPTWSPDSNQIAYVSGASGNLDIYVISASDGSPILTLTSDENNDYDPTWLPRNDVSLLAFTSNRFGDDDIFVINPSDASGLTQITTDGSNESQPEWSSDGNLIVFVSDRDNNGEENVYTMTPDGNNVNRLTPNGSRDRQPDWK